MTRHLTDKQAAEFGRAVYEILDAAEWDSDTLQAIGDYAALVMGIPFSEPADEDEDDIDTFPF